MPTIPSAENKLEVPTVVPIEQVRPVVPATGTWPQVVALAEYMTKTEVHTYAFSVAANVILSLFPFIVMMMTISRQVFHSEKMAHLAGDMISTFLPSNLTIDQSFIMDRMLRLAHPHKGTQIYAVVMLLISSTGVFLPLEVALNSVWGVTRNRSYMHNQAVALGLAFAAGVLAMCSVALTTGLTWIFFGHTQNFAFNFLVGGSLRVLALVVSILIFFLIYWILPNRKVPPRAVLPTAIMIGLLWEAAKYLYVLVLPKLDFPSVYGPFYVSVGLMIWAFLSGLLLLAGAHFSATRFALSVARQSELEKESEKEADADRA
jgi:YihY family inner membrane protein